MPTIAARSIKVTVVLDTATAREALAPLQTLNTRIKFAVVTEGRRLDMDFAPKAVRRAFATIEEHGTDNVAVIIQGKLMPDNTVAEAGILAQLKVRKAEPVAA